MADIFHSLVIFPVEGIIELVYLLFSRVTHSTGLAIAGVSLAVNVLTLPLYARAERLQALERETRKRLQPKIDDIKAVFKGDERLMILSTYYRQNHYHPIYALRSSFGLFLQVPFFIAAYSFLSSLPELSGRGFWLLRDLSKPDGLLSFGGAAVNLLPIIMTLVNVAASAVYARGLPVREKAQLYGMAAIFLALLYASPSGLVLYWTLNNMFSFVKNVFYRLKRPLVAFWAIMAILSVGAAGAALFVLDTTARKRLVVVALAGFVLAAPLLAALGRRLLDSTLAPGFKNPKETAGVFILSALALTVLAGIAVPSALIGSSPQEFAFAGASRGPADFIGRAFSESAGLFLLWPALLYALAGWKARAGLAAAFAVLAAGALVNVFAFGGSYGAISPQLLFQSAGVLRETTIMSGLNIAALLAAALGVVVLIRLRKARVLSAAAAICLVGLATTSGVKAYAIATGLEELRVIRAVDEGVPKDGEFEPTFTFTNTGRNVFVIMLDRGISAFVRYAMEDDPGLAEKYRGFVWYPNTLSFNPHTLAGAPPLYGGYEYTPQAINARSGESLVSKHNEALAVLPRAFAEEGWRSAISDASWANYSWVPDNTIFRKYPGIRAFNLTGRYTQRWLEEHGMAIDPTARIDRCLTRFSLLKLAPTPLRYGIYDQGKWWDSRYVPDEYADFIDKYAALDYLPELVAVDDGADSFALMVNDTAHDSAILDADGWVPARNPRRPDTPRFADDFTERTYRVNAASLRMIGRFLDKLRAEGVYDNTRIIIVADHGADLALPEFADFPRNPTRAPAFNPLFMVKDFGSDSDFAVDRSFRTNADTPALATATIGREANPFTGQPFRTLAPGESVTIVDKPLYDPSDQKRNTLDFGPEDLIVVKDDLFSETNWDYAR
ncbi:MAG: YidC/Oxa1 family membrane protein insertase [Spirochaetales bacterium]|nr:YidC/Oxa1 family membrane protein insertase [Spirochaetales bacterium]